MPSTIGDEVTFISSVNPDGTLALNGFWAWNGDSPATYTGGYTQAAKWGAPTAGTAGGTISYYFDPASSWSATEQQCFTATLALWSAVANITFVQTTNAAAAQIKLTRGNDDKAATDIDTTTPAGGGLTGGSVLLQLTSATTSIDTSTPGFGPIDGSFTAYGGYVWGTLVHEIGHALGLGHGGPYNGDVNASTQQFSPYDSLLWSTMSYIEPRTSSAKYYYQYPTAAYWGMSAPDAQGHRYYNTPTTWMPLDILALQRLYGAPVSSPLSGGQRFGFNCNIAGSLGQFFDFTKNTNPIITIWDMGGNNTLDLSGFSSIATINLNPGTFSSCNGLTSNIAIAFNTAIDTLVCGSGSNTVTCNDDGDTVYGNAGQDWITGGAGNDVFYGGAGYDSLKGAAGNDDFSGSGLLVIDGGVGDDRATIDHHSQTSGDLITFTANSSTTDWWSSGTTLVRLEHLFLTTGSGNDTATFTDPSYDVTWGGNSWDAGAGNDTANVVLSSDTAGINAGISGGNCQILRNASGSWVTALTLTNVETFSITTGSGNDTLTGSAGKDTLNGGAGTNAISGGDGDDTLSDCGTGSTIDGGAGVDTLTLDRHLMTSAVTATVTPGASFALPDGTQVQNIEKLTLTTGSGNDTLTFNLGSWTTSWIGGAGVDTANLDLSAETRSFQASNDGSLYVNNTVFLTLSGVERFNFTAGSGNDFVAADSYSASAFNGGSGNDEISLTGSGLTGANALVLTPGGSGSLPNGVSFSNFEHFFLTTTSGDNQVTFNNPLFDSVWGGNSWTASGGNNTAIVNMSANTTGINMSGSSSSSSPYASYSFCWAGYSTPALQLNNMRNVIVTGGSGNDLLGGGPGNDSFDGGGGIDYLLYYNDTAGMTVNVLTHTITGPWVGTDTFANIERITSGRGDDTLIGDDLANDLDGFQGRNTITAGGGNDTVGDSGRGSTLDGGAGTDLLNLDRSQSTTPLNMTFTPGVSGTLADGTTFQNFEYLYLSAGDGDDTISFVAPRTMSSFWNTVYGKLGTDTVSVDLSASTASVKFGKTSTNPWYLSIGSDLCMYITDVERFAIKGGSGADNFIGGAGVDVFTGNGGDDIINGGLGRDRAIFAGPMSGYIVTRYGNGSALVSGPDGSDYLTGIEVLQFSDQSTLIGSTVEQDFDNDGDADIVLQKRDGSVMLWSMSGSSVAAMQSYGASTGTWTIKGLGDFDGSGTSDILWQNAAGQLQVWKMNGTSVGGIGAVFASPGFDWIVKGTGDFDGDGRCDILLQNTNGQASVLFANNPAGPVTLVGSNPGFAWSIVGTGDFNGDGQVDILWQNAGGQAGIWLMNGTQILTSPVVGPDPGPSWKIICAADFNGDCKSDILWQCDDGQAGIWLMDGTTVLALPTVGTNPGATTRIVNAEDLNFDGKADIVWQNASGQVSTWFMNGTNVLYTSTLSTNPGTDWRVANDGAAAQVKRTRSDFSGDGKADVLWQSDSGQAGMWLLNGTTVISSPTVGNNPGPSWHVKGSGDFDGDGKSDILWQSDSGQAGIWLMDGTNVLSAPTVGPNPGPTWKVICSGDFDGNGKADILWQSTSGQAGIWFMNGTTPVALTNTGSNPGSIWHVKGSGDFNGDGKADILWQSDTGQAGIWLMNGTTVLSAVDVGSNPGSAWHVKGTGDFDGNGKSDILWQNDSGQAGIWFMNGTTVLSGVDTSGNPGWTWQVKGAADVNGDGKSDILWQNVNGQAGVWVMNGNTPLSQPLLGGNPGTSWHVVAGG